MLNLKNIINTPCNTKYNINIINRDVTAFGIFFKARGSVHRNSM